MDADPGPDNGDMHSQASGQSFVYLNPSDDEGPGPLADDWDAGSHPEAGEYYGDVPADGGSMGGGGGGGAASPVSGGSAADGGHHGPAVHAAGGAGAAAGGAGAALGDVGMAALALHFRKAGVSRDRSTAILGAIADTWDVTQKPGAHTGPFRRDGRAFVRAGDQAVAHHGAPFNVVRLPTMGADAALASEAAVPPAAVVPTMYVRSPKDIVTLMLNQPELNAPGTMLWQETPASAGAAGQPFYCDDNLVALAAWVRQRAVAAAYDPAVVVPILLEFHIDGVQVDESGRSLEFVMVRPSNRLLPLTELPCNYVLAAVIDRVNSSLKVEYQALIQALLDEYRTCAGQFWHMTGTRALGSDWADRSVLVSTVIAQFNGDHPALAELWASKCNSCSGGCNVTACSDAARAAAAAAHSKPPVLMTQKELDAWPGYVERDGAALAEAYRQKWSPTSTDAQVAASTAVLLKAGLAADRPCALWRFCRVYEPWVVMERSGSSSVHSDVFHTLHLGLIPYAFEALRTAMDDTGRAALISYISQQPPATIEGRTHRAFSSGFFSRSSHWGSDWAALMDPVVAFLVLKGDEVLSGWPAGRRRTACQLFGAFRRLVKLCTVWSASDAEVESFADAVDVVRSRLLSLFPEAGWHRKIKFHLLLHAVDTMRRQRTLLLSSAAQGEAYNRVVVKPNIKLSNKHDLAAAIASGTVLTDAMARAEAARLAAVGDNDGMLAPAVVALLRGPRDPSYRLQASTSDVTAVNAVLAGLHQRITEMAEAPDGRAPTIRFYRRAVMDRGASATTLYAHAVEAGHHHLSTLMLHGDGADDVMAMDVAVALAFCEVELEAGAPPRPDTAVVAESGAYVAVLRYWMHDPDEGDHNAAGQYTTRGLGDWAAASVELHPLAVVARALRPFPAYAHDPDGSDDADAYTAAMHATESSVTRATAQRLGRCLFLDEWWR
jgi:hypothetical protein